MKVCVSIAAFVTFGVSIVSGALLADENCNTTNAGGASTGGACLYCVIDGRRHAGGTTMDYRRGCIKYRCQCNCRGYAICRPYSLTNCSPDDACRRCQVEGKTYNPNSKFTFEQNCMRVSCKCGCDGSAACDRTPIPNCNVNQGCKECVFRGVRRDAYEKFTIENTCQRTVCQCRCDGEIRCSAPVRKCAIPRPGNCIACNLGGKYYEGGTSFDFIHGPWKFPCSCDCQGRYRCDRSRAEYLDDTNSDGSRGGSSNSRRTSSTRANSFTRSSSSSRSRMQIRRGRYVLTDPLDRNGCRICRPGNVRARPNSEFELNEDCKRFVGCRCNCDGSWICPSQIPINTCSGSHSGRSNCSCEVQGKLINPGQRFVLRYDDCRGLRCSCSDACTGRYDCENDLTCVRSPCRSCTKNGITYGPGETFDDPEHTICKCECNGRIKCPAAASFAGVTLEYR